MISTCCSGLARADDVLVRNNFCLRNPLPEYHSWVVNSGWCLRPDLGTTIAQASELLARRSVCHKPCARAHAHTHTEHLARASNARSCEVFPSHAVLARTRVPNRIIHGVSLSRVFHLALALVSRSVVRPVLRIPGNERKMHNNNNKNFSQTQPRVFHFSFGKAA